jgi:hypothetical protein
MLSLLKRRNSMEELLCKLETIILIRKAISQTYNSISDTDKFVDCSSFIDDIEEQVVVEYSNKDGSL